jgi:hypothetical protein
VNACAKWHRLFAALNACLSIGILFGCSSAVPPQGSIGAGAGYIITLSSGVPSPQPDPALEYKNFYGICWNGTNADNLRFAINMGYKYVFYNYGMENEPGADGMYFYVETPRYTVYPSLFNDYRIQAGHAYTAAEKANIEQYFAWKGNADFPGNIARAGFTTAPISARSPISSSRPSSTIS